MSKEKVAAGGSRKGSGKAKDTATGMQSGGKSLEQAQQ